MKTKLSQKIRKCLLGLDAVLNKPIVSALLNDIKWAGAHHCYNLTINQFVQYTKWGLGSKDTLP